MNATFRILAVIEGMLVMVEETCSIDMEALQIYATVSEADILPGARGVRRAACAIT
jgi:hypothetical protein